MQNTDSGLVRLFAELMPSLRPTGTSTSGSRMPPSTMPLLSRSTVVGGPGLLIAIGGAARGAMPLRTQLSSASYAAWNRVHDVTWLGPGLVQSTGAAGPNSRVWMPPRVDRKFVASGSVAYAGTCDAPAIVHVRSTGSSGTFWLGTRAPRS